MGVDLSTAIRVVPTELTNIPLCCTIITPWRIGMKLLEVPIDDTRGVHVERASSYLLICDQMDWRVDERRRIEVIPGVLS